MFDLIYNIIQVTAIVSALLSVLVTYRVSRRVKEIESRLQTKEGAIERLGDEEDIREYSKDQVDMAGDSNDE